MFSITSVVLQTSITNLTSAHHSPIPVGSIVCDAYYSLELTIVISENSGKLNNFPWLRDQRRSATIVSSVLAVEYIFINWSRYNNNRGKYRPRANPWPVIEDTWRCNNIPPEEQNSFYNWYFPHFLFLHFLMCFACGWISTFSSITILTINRPEIPPFLAKFRHFYFSSSYVLNGKFYKNICINMNSSLYFLFPWAMPA